MIPISSLYPRVQLTIHQHRITWFINSFRPCDAYMHESTGSSLVQVMAWCHQATRHYLNQCCPRSMSPYGVTRSQWVNRLNLLTYPWPLAAVYVYLEPAVKYGFVQNSRGTKLLSRHLFSKRCRRPAMSSGLLLLGETLPSSGQLMLVSPAK